ncbi:hypothetical protein [Streptomyces sp. NPDC047042]|uniref:hypothetical protein n=1 Tax=Streptomyces sp. NPDC047042 TaxID=3154807 RepID=UPI0034036AB7
MITSAPPVPRLPRHADRATADAAATAWASAARNGDPHAAEHLVRALESVQAA